MTTFAQDFFTDTNGTALASHTPDVGGSWIVHTSFIERLEIDTNACRYNNVSVNTAGVDYNNGTPSGADYYVQGDFIPLQATLAVGSGSYLCGRVSTVANTMYLFGFEPSGVLCGGNWSAYQVVAGTVTQINVSTAQTLTQNQAYSVRLDMTGTTISTTVDSSAKCGSPNTNVNIAAAGKTGIRVGDLAQDLRWDNFLAVDPSGSAVYRFRALLGVGL